MDSDDLPVGTILSRRAALELLGTSTVGAWLSVRLRRGGEGVVDCVVRPEQTEGPYFVDHQLERRDIRSEPATGAVKGGAVLDLAFTVLQAGTACAPIKDAIVDVWQCDAQGVYSGVMDPSFDTKGLKYLRGFQRTDAAGLARFTTIVPGWYPGRTVHIHFKVRTKDAKGAAWEFTSQLYFADAFSDAVFAANPAYRRSGKRDTTNASDGIFGSGGSQLTLVPRRTSAGWAADFRIGMDLANAATGRGDHFDMGGGSPPGGRGGPPPGGRPPRP